ncbi:MFS-type transporter involved in bile tolerance, Atg22 family [Methylomagnum ishizawai]|uniref:MFS-type transporter involved in bile tolerance, Atg22 family n=1 Tax=Methylomagnum ishizawai TaxID=1760988 RepID=A0A1Y6D562_9GAMM|nr:MFS transporter [Methylomagnum ishizawai]SMF95095.1 MFS-type transporter involved in bile tolerance, Atg22 family [Methylomagnum ishizawai]
MIPARRALSRARRPGLLAVPARPILPMMPRAVLQLPATVWMLGCISFLNDTAGELVYPLLPIYFAVVLQVEPRIFGFIEGSALAVNSLLQLVSGRAADRSRSAKGWVVAGYGIAAVSRPMLAFAQSWPVAMGFRLADRMGKGLRSSPRDALLALSAAPGQRGLAFGFHRAMDNVGAVAGPLMAAWLLEQKADLRQVLLWTAVPGLLTVALTLCLKDVEREARPAVPFDWRIGTFSLAFRRYLLVLGVFTLGFPSSLFLLLRARELGVPDAELPLLWAGVSLVAALCSTGFSAWSDRVGRKTMIVAGWWVYSAILLLLGFDGWSKAWLWPLFAMYGLFFAATEGAQKALVADMVPRHGVGTAFGWFNLVTGLLLLPASLIFGGLTQAFGSAWAFGFSAACAVAATVLLIVAVPRPERHPDP